MSITEQNRSSVVPVVLGYKLDVSEFESRWGKEISLSSETSRPVLGPTQSAIQ